MPKRITNQLSYVAEHITWFFFLPGIFTLPIFFIIFFAISVMYVVVFASTQIALDHDFSLFSGQGWIFRLSFETATLFFLFGIFCNLCYSRVAQQFKLTQLDVVKNDAYLTKPEDLPPVSADLMWRWARYSFLALIFSFLITTSGFLGIAIIFGDPENVTSDALWFWFLKIPFMISIAIGVLSYAFQNSAYDYRHMANNRSRQNSRRLENDSAVKSEATTDKFHENQGVTTQDWRSNLLEQNRHLEAAADAADHHAAFAQLHDPDKAKIARDRAAKYRHEAAQNLQLIDQLAS